MTVDDAFTTERLRVGDWHAAEPRGSGDLAAVVAAMLTGPVTRWLPPDWQGTYTPSRAAEWITQRDTEGSVLLVEGREDGQPLGLVLLFEEPVRSGIDVRLGYLFAEHAWGRGLGTELLGGVVAWCRDQPEVRSIIGGVARENTASLRTLERHGFVCEPEQGSGGELTCRLAL